MRREVLRFEHVTYKENEKTLLQDFDLNIFEGEIMGLMPIGAYGLPALLKILEEYSPLYHGYIYYQEKLVDSWVNDSISRNRVSVIGDISSLVDGQSVLTNVMILRRGYRQRFLNYRFLKRQLQPFIDDVGIPLNPLATVEKLTSFERIVVEILRAVVAGHKLIVMKEISTIISDSEIDKLYEIMRKYAKKGFSFLYISPHFEEIVQICDRAAFMMNRRIIKIMDCNENPREIAKYCAQEYISNVQERLIQRKPCNDNVIFSVNGLTGKYLNNLSFDVHEGECLVVQCLEQRISKEILDILECREYPVSGRFYLGGRRITAMDNRDIAVILEQPWENMIFEDMSVMDNLCMCMDHRIPQVWMSYGVQKSIRDTVTEQLGVEIFDNRVAELTDLQRSEIVYTRILLQKPKIVFCIQPFKGEDVPHRLLIWKLQKRLLDQGIAVVIIAVNMADALSLADRVIRIDKNTHITEYERKDFDKLPSTVPWYFLYQNTD
ncbi:MAG: sugar ABC transporter ATP-binding protein [Coprococcus sp.]